MIPDFEWDNKSNGFAPPFILFHQWTPSHRRLPVRALRPTASCGFKLRWAIFASKTSVAVNEGACDRHWQYCTFRGRDAKTFTTAKSVIMPSILCKRKSKGQWRNIFWDVTMFKHQAWLLHAQYKDYDCPFRMVLWIVGCYHHKSRYRLSVTVAFKLRIEWGSHGSSQFLRCLKFLCLTWQFIDPFICSLNCGN